MLYLPVYMVVFLKVINVAVGSFYANNYPYIGVEEVNVGSSLSSDAHGAADNNAYLQKKAHDHSNDVQASQHGVNFYDKDNISKGHDLTHIKNGASVDDHKHVVGQNLETDKSHNRKHIKSGFHNTYNKDESGSNSSFYEDSDDRGGKLVYDKSHGVTGDAHDQKYHEGVRDGQLRDRLDDRHGGYNSRGKQDRQHYMEQDQGDRHGYHNKYDRGQGERINIYNERPSTENRYYKPEVSPLIDHRRPIDYPYPVSGYINGHSPRLPVGGDLPPPPLPLNRGQDDGYFSRHRITIYDDPRELIDPRRTEAERREAAAYMNNVGGGSGSIYHNPRLDFRPSPLRLRDYYDEKRDHLRYRDRDY